MRKRMIRPVVLGALLTVGGMGPALADLDDDPPGPRGGPGRGPRW